LSGPRERYRIERRRQDEAALDVFLNYIEVLDFPGQASPHYARIRADLRRLGTAIGAKIGANDLFIAAHARSLGLALVTNNTREFGRVSRLVIENWTL
jgi:tRNA(fMet)-specific endonuclease VapC